MQVDVDQISALIQEAAAEEILPHFISLEQDDIAEKSPGDLVTAVDLAMEARLTRQLPDALPGSVVVGEEAVAADSHVLDVLMGKDPVWIVDPVDGTANFASGLPMFAVIVALVVEDQTRIGWIYDPISGRMAVASRGEGAWMGGQRMQVRKPVTLREMTGSIYGRRFRQSDAVRRIWGGGRGRLGALFNTRCVGQEYLARIQGRMHFGLYTRLNPWDHAAGILLHEEAGGYGALFDGSAYRPVRPSPGILVTPDRELWDHLHEQVIASVEER